MIRRYENEHYEKNTHDHRSIHEPSSKGKGKQVDKRRRRLVLYICMIGYVKPLQCCIQIHM